MKRRQLENMTKLQPGTLFRVTENADNDYGRDFLVMDTTKTGGYDIVDVATTARFGAYDSDIPSYERLLTFSSDETEKALYEKALPTLAQYHGELLLVKELGLTYPNLNETDPSINISCAVSFDDQSPGNFNFKLRQRGRVEVRGYEFDIGKLIGYKPSQGELLTEEQMAQLEDEFKVSGVRFVGERLLDTMQDILILNNQSRGFLSINDAYTRLTTIVTGWGEKYKFRAVFPQQG
jgi:hypothetical protein